MGRGYEGEDRRQKTPSILTEKQIIEFEVGDNLASLYRSMCLTPSQRYTLHKLLKEYKKQMSEATDRLKSAVDDDQAALGEGLGKFDGAFAELVSDIANLPQAADINTEAARISANAAAMRAAFATIDTKVRDAIPTAAGPLTDQQRYQAYLDSTTDSPPLDFDTWLSQNPA